MGNSLVNIILKEQTEICPADADNAFEHVFDAAVSATFYTVAVGFLL